LGRSGRAHERVKDSKSSKKVQTRRLDFVAAIEGYSPNEGEGTTRKNSYSSHREERSREKKEGDSTDLTGKEARSSGSPKGKKSLAEQGETCTSLEDISQLVHDRRGVESQYDHEDLIEVKTGAGVVA